MGSGIRKILEITWKFAKPMDRGIGITLICLIVLVAFLAARGEAIYTDYRAIWCLVCLALYFIAIVPPVKRMTDRRHELLFYVATWGIVSLVLVLVAFYAIYFVLTGSQTQWDRVLNLPPVFAAVFGTAIGWYVHQQLSAKLHRTSNSFNLVMQTRTSAEFLKHTRSLYAVYPPPREFPAEDNKYFQTQKRTEVDRIGRELASKANPDDAKKLTYLNDLAKVEAVEGLKYLLNFYEFMALGVHMGDLDETLLYETISPSVVGWYDRSKTYCDQIRAKNGNKLAYQHLHKLVDGYTTKEGDHDVPVEGWRKRLELEKANTPNF
jgi:Domain of unknown function (DUF4760)